MSAAGTQQSARRSTAARPAGSGRSNPAAPPRARAATPARRPIVTLRWFSKIFFQIFDVLSFSVLLLALDCQTFARPADQIGRIQEYPDVRESRPHVTRKGPGLRAAVVASWWRLLIHSVLSTLTLRGRCAHGASADCLSMPHLATAAVAIAALIVFVLLAGLFVVGEMELDFTTRNQLALMHTG